MLCTNCLKNQSNYQFTKIINGNKTEYHLCENCAREKGDIIQGPANSFSIHNLLSGMLNIEFGFGSPNQTKATDTRCSTCGMTFREFSKKGRFGCADCYKAFSAQLEPLIRRMQQNNLLHAGKSPDGGVQQPTDQPPDLSTLIAQLEEELQAEIRNEHYERAAVLRDRIAGIRKQTEQSDLNQSIDGVGPAQKGTVKPKQWIHFDTDGGEEV